MKRNVKIFCAALALVLVFGAVVGGTLAWLTDKTESVTNTFVVGNVAIELTEEAGTDNDLNFKMVPGNSIAKDPKVTVKSGSESCWIFVKVDESDNLDTYIEYTAREKWTVVAGGGEDDGYVVYGYNEIVSADDVKDQDFYLLAEGEDGYENGYVTVKTSVTTGDMAAAETNKPTLTFTAYAIQSENLEKTTVQEVWMTYSSEIVTTTASAEG